MAMTRILTSIGSAASVAFGVWHLFVPSVWHWYSYIDAAATELTLAVRALNVCFSTSLVVLGLVNLFMVFGQSGRYPLLVVLAANISLWSVRVAMQVVYPQGTTSSALQYGMLAAFITVLACYVAAAGLVVSRSGMQGG